jgi:hypothetical protein
LRELTFLQEQYHQPWAKEFKGLLLELKTAVAQARARGDLQLPAAERRAFVSHDEDLLTAGRAANPPPERPPGQRGRVKQSPACHLLERLSLGQGEVLAFLYDLTIPFDTNQAEQDLRMPESPAEDRRLVPGGQRLGRLRAHQRLLRLAPQAGGRALSCLADRLYRSASLSRLGLTSPAPAKPTSTSR